MKETRTKGILRSGEVEKSEVGKMGGRKLSRERGSRRSRYEG